MANGRHDKRRKSNRKNRFPATLANLSPQQIAVIAGLLTNALSVDSVLVDKDQRLQIVLGGSLRRKTPLDRLIQELQGNSLKEIIEALNNQ